MNEEQVSIRLPAELLGRLEKLARRLAADPLRGALGVTRAAVLRLALTRGIEILEAETQKGRKQ
jgi:predicted DNA-binding protein